MRARRSAFPHLLQDQGRHTEARDLLAPVYDWFAEGFDTPTSKTRKRCSTNSGLPDGRSGVAARPGSWRYEQVFQVNEIDWEALSKLTAEDLKDLGVVLGGHRRKLLDAIIALRGGDLDRFPRQR